jgi:predicted dehydrogenase
MLELSRKRDVATSCGYMVAYNPIFQKLKQIIESDKFGEITSFDSFCYISQVFKKKTPKSKWQYDPAKTGGGVLITMAGHLIFLLQWYFGECLSVRGSMRSFYTTMDDEVHTRLVFKNGLEGQLKTSWSVRGYDDLTIGLTINTKRAIIKATNTLIVIKDKKSGGTKEIHISNVKDDAKFELGGKGYYNQDFDFINSIGKNKKPVTNWENSFKTQEIIEAIYRSIKTKKEERCKLIE